MKENKILKWALILSIVIVANLFFNYTLSLTLNSPDLDEFCPPEKISQNIETKSACEEANGTWEAYYFEKDPVVGRCDLYSKCSDAYREAHKAYEQKIFIALIVIGVIILNISFFIPANPVLTSAFALTAFLNFVIASIRYWQYSDEFLKVGILFIALSALIYLAIKKFKIN